MCQKRTFGHKCLKYFTDLTSFLTPSQQCQSTEGYPPYPVKFTHSFVIHHCTPYERPLLLYTGSPKPVYNKKPLIRRCIDYMWLTLLIYSFSLCLHLSGFPDFTLSLSAKREFLLLWSWTLAYDLHLERVEANHHAKYIRQRSFRLTVIMWTYTEDVCGPQGGQ